MRFHTLVFVALAACSGPQAPTHTGPAGGQSGAAAPPAFSATPVASETPGASAPPGELDVDPASFDFAQNPELVKRISESPHAYFRFVGHRFAAAVCKRLSEKDAGSPPVRLHGDPHVEQYAVTDLGRWMSDYDDASVGPPSIDLVRFGTSAILAARQHGLSQADTDALLAEMFRGYAEGLQNKALPKDVPAFAAGMMAGFVKDRTGFLDSAEKNILLADAAEEKLARGKLDEYVATLKKAGKAPKDGFFAVKRIGRLKLGIGSALTRKYLLRVEGPSKIADDDVILEIKEVADLSQVPCVKSLPGGAALARSEIEPTGGKIKLLAPMLLPDGRFWVNEWLSNYQEARLKKLKPADLKALVYELGLMLGREHIKPLPDSPAPSADALALKEADIQALRKAMAELADASTHGWERFTNEVAKRKELANKSL